MRSSLAKSGIFSMSMVAGTLAMLTLCPGVVFSQSQDEAVLRGQTPMVAPTWTGMQMASHQPTYSEAPVYQAYGQEPSPTYGAFHAPNTTYAANYGDEFIYSTSSGCDCESCTLRGEGLIPCRYKRMGLFYVDGWVSAGGATENQAPLINGGRGFNDTALNNVQMNQAYLIIGRETRKCGTISLGGRVDLLYGTDYLYTSALGLESSKTNALGAPVSTVYAAQPGWNTNNQGGYPEYGLAMPQAYAELYAPVGHGLTIKGGHFYSPLGYESVMSPSNFFYTHTYSMLYGEAKTLTGMLATQQLTPYWSIMGGFAQGWDTWESANSALSWIAGAKWANLNKTSSLSFAMMSGNQVVETFYKTNREYSGEYRNANISNYSLVYEQQLTPALQYVLQHDLGVATDGARTWDSTDRKYHYTDGKWYSITNYLYYQLSDKLAVGGRFEWFKDENLSRILSSPVSYRDGSKFVGDNFYNASIGVNWKPTSWFTIRPEARIDWSDTKYVDSAGDVIWPGVFSDFTKSKIYSFNCDAIIRF